MYVRSIPLLFLLKKIRLLSISVLNVPMSALNCGADGEGKEACVFTVEFDEAPKHPMSTAAAVSVIILKFFICFLPMSYNLYSFLLALSSSYFKGLNMNYTKSLLLFFISFLFISCATVSCGEINTRPNTLDMQHTRELPRKSFLKINKGINFKK